MLTLEKVSKVYRTGALGLGKLTAVFEVSFEIGEKEIVALIGESGSGKSTIGKMILRLIPPTSGTIRFEGKDIFSLKGQGIKEYYRKVQGVFQDPFASYNPIFKADRIFTMLREEFFPGISRSQWERKVEEALRAVGLNPPDVLGKYPHQLSGGQLQRFLIARALLLDIRLLVADEIISMLDASTRVDVLNLLADLRDRGLSILFITHDLSLGHYISDRSLVLYRGRIVEMGPTERVYARPLHPYTEMLMASVPRLDQKWTRERTHIERGAAYGSSGCVYYGRCPIAQEICTRRAPELVEVEAGHHVACHLRS
ncbi:ABC transporter ATP-binding protein [Thermoflexus sp.]|uniref:ABC transporter ATP-binding protein n=1 Tax=Thermoflexus sp. TaxID=1969742 RepID=UPI0025E04334|nr:ABC transporter ATP-binding protein [Thermoflexus sp.]MDW8179969.1 ABC transporter ATP-binding protein [Anaerolineae bacterium]MCS6962522.1 ABC transporter ATP-binding protein [Thermoflexus sp.]MCS7350518.1 ABC transporter ATP-binding protein [Thermoflexus sp.]MCX7690309.1 ABC transporter ATP-binding protein [Thermoflexus sp.]MDW8183639.1 ABC transporter ATP-binding protein [Anaerolineae bacterium]